MTSGEDLTWRQAGGAYYAEADGRIVALLYWYREGHYLHGPDAEVEPSEPGWFVVMVDEPDHHRAMRAPAPAPDEELADLRDATRAALEGATQVVVGCLDAARRA